MKKLSINKKGFTLLFASLVVSLLLSVGLAILNITLAQVLLSSSAKESQFAFYNADTGIECALYFDKNAINGKVFATSSQTTNVYGQSDISCDNGQTTPINWTSDQVNSPGITSFDLDFHTNECTPPSPSPIVNIKVIKTYDGINTHTQIQARGYNTCNSSNPRRVERGLQVNY